MNYKNSRKRFYRVFKVVFTLLGIILTGYMFTKLIIRYMKNENTTAIQNRKFNTRPSDLYPAFSLCVEDHYGGLYNTTFISKHLGNMTKRLDYQNVLLGKIDNLPDSLDLNETKFLEIDSESAAVSFREIIFYCHITYLNASRKIKNRHGGVYSPDLPHFYLSYKDPVKMCFTRESVFERGIARKQDLVMTKMARLLTSIFGVRAKLVLYIHQQGQLIRNFDRPIHDFFPMNIFPNDNYMVINIVQVSVLRRRPDGNYPCDPDLNDDDKEFLYQITKKVGCVPPYWKNLINESIAVSRCNSTFQLNEAYQQIKAYTRVLEHYNPPCDEMTVTSTLNVNYVRTGVQIQYMVFGYEEMIDRREFGFELFWSSTGGFIGMFLGASLLQIPDLLFYINLR